jgi:hypothetical protein
MLINQKLTFTAKLSGKYFLTSQGFPFPEIMDVSVVFKLADSFIEKPIMTNKFFITILTRLLIVLTIIALWLLISL